MVELVLRSPVLIKMRPYQHASPRTKLGFLDQHLWSLPVPSFRITLSGGEFVDRDVFR